MSWRLERTRQCGRCPWRKGVDPRTIPNGYSVDHHRRLAATIARPADLGSLGRPLAVMACHETERAHCVGWLAQQLGPGNNLALRMHVLDCENIGAIQLFGPQHERFEDTLPPSGKEG